MTRDWTPDLLALPWRTARPGGLVVVAQTAGVPHRTDDLLVGVMASAELAVLVCEAHNDQLSVHPGAGDANRVIRARLAAVEAGESPAPQSA
jgi:hypothetical protein